MRISTFLFFAASLADGVLMPFFALWAVREAGVPIAAVGLLLGCYAGGELLATPFVGGLSDRLGRRPVLLGATLGVALGFLALFFAHGIFAATAALLVIGVFESGLHPTAAAVIADVVAPAELRRYYGLMRMAASIGGALGPALGALLVVWSLNSVFLVAAGALLVACLVVAVGLRETRAGTEPTADDDGLGALGAVFRDRRLAALLLPLAVIEIASSWIEAVVPLQATGAGTLTAAGVGWLFAYASLLGVVAQMPVLRLCRSAPGWRVALAGTGLLVLAFAALTALPGSTGPLVAVTGLALAGMLIEPMVQALVMELAPVDARATYTAALSAVHDLKDAAGPAAGTALFAVAAALPWLVAIGLIVPVGSVLVARLRGNQQIASRAG